MPKPKWRAVRGTKESQVTLAPRAQIVAQHIPRLCFRKHLAGTREGCAAVGRLATVSGLVSLKRWSLACEWRRIGSRAVPPERAAIEAYLRKRISYLPAGQGP